MSSSKSDPSPGKNDSLENELAIYLMRGLNLPPIKEVPRLDPSTETVRRKGGIIGTFNTVRLVNVSDRATDTVQNPKYQETWRESYRLGDIWQHEDRGGEFVAGRGGDF